MSAIPIPAAAKGSWSDGEAYDLYMGRWSARVAGRFVAWLGVPRDARWLDVGSGTGRLAAAVLENGAPSRVDAVDRSREFLDHATETLRDARLRTHVADATSLPFADATFDAAVSGLCLNFVANPSAAVREMVRTSRRGAAIGAYVWDYAGEMQMVRLFWDAGRALDPSCVSLDEGRSPVCREEALRELFAANGIDEVMTMPIRVMTPYRNFDEYWSAFLLGQGVLGRYTVSLDSDARAALRRELHRRTGDGPLALTARALCVRGRIG